MSEEAQCNVGVLSTFQQHRSCSNMSKSKFLFIWIHCQSSGWVFLLYVSDDCQFSPNTLTSHHPPYSQPEPGPSYYRTNIKYSPPRLPSQEGRKERGKCVKKLSDWSLTGHSLARRQSQGGAGSEVYVPLWSSHWHWWGWASRWIITLLLTHITITHHSIALLKRPGYKHYHPDSLLF